MANSAALTSAGRLGLFAAAVGGAIYQIAFAPLPAGYWITVFAVFLMFNTPSLRWSGLMLISGALAVSVVAKLHLGLAIGPAVERASFLMAFLFVLQYMGQLVAGSDDVARGARLIAAQPPGRRYVFFSFGSHLLSLFLQLGGLLILIGMLAARAGHESVATMRALATGALRGFAATAFWSPLSLSILVTFSSVTGISYLAFLPVGIGAAAGFMLLGLWMERARRSAVADASARAQPLGVDDRRLILRLVAPVAGLIAGGLGLVAVFGLALIEGVFLAVFTMAAVWSVAQATRRGMALRDAVLHGTGGIANEVAIICGAVVIGTVAADAVLATEVLSGALDPRTAIAAAAAIPAIILATSLLAINPLVTVTLLAGALDAVWPDSAKLWLVFALTGGWSVAACGSPLTASMLMSAKRLDLPATRLAFAWNGHFSLVALLIVTLIAVIGTMVTGARLS